jgi:hypothetical protein
MLFAFMIAKIISRYKFDAQRPSVEHVHHPPDEEQRQNTEDYVGGPVAS